MTHNICGNACGPLGPGNLERTAAIKDVISAVDVLPISVGLNEVCGTWNDVSNQAGDVKDFLYGLNNLYLGRTRAQLVAGNYCNSLLTPYGIAEYVFSTDRTPPISTGAFTPAPGDGENRGWLCINGGVDTPKYWGCTAHMNNTNPGASVTGAPAEVQFAEYYGNGVRPKAATKPVYWGGDLYVFVNEIPAIPVPGGGVSFSTSQEADLCTNGTYRWTHRNKSSGALAKYDYTFRSGPNRNPCPFDANLHPASASDMFPVGSFTSDHRIVVGHQPCC